MSKEIKAKEALEYFKIELDKFHDWISETVESNEYYDKEVLLNYSIINSTLSQHEALVKGVQSLVERWENAEAMAYPHNMQFWKYQEMFVVLKQLLEEDKV